MMEIQFNSGLQGRPAAFFAHKITNALSRYESTINSVIIGLAGGKEIRPHHQAVHCVLEARPVGADPILVSHEGGTNEQAVNGAIFKLKSALEHTMHGLNHHKT